MRGEPCLLLLTSTWNQLALADVTYEYVEARLCGTDVPFIWRLPFQEHCSWTSEWAFLEGPFSTTAGCPKNCPLPLVGRFPSLMGSFSTLMGSFPACLNGPFPSWKFPGKQPIKKGGSSFTYSWSFFAYSWASLLQSAQALIRRTFPL